MNFPLFVKTACQSLLFTSMLATTGCSNPDESRIETTGTISIQGQPVPSGTLVLTSRADGQMPVATRISAGKFAFDKLTGPRPGEYVARVNPDEATIEEIADAASQNPHDAARKFNANASNPSIALPEATVVISNESKVITIELK